MIWLKSFGNAVGNAFQFGISGFFLGMVVNGGLGAVFGLIIAIPVGFWGTPTSYSWTGRAWDAVGASIFLSAIYGGLIAAVIMSISGFLRGWRPNPPDFMQTFRGLTWGSWLCAIAGGWTAVPMIYLWCSSTGNGARMQLFIAGYTMPVMLFCYTIGAIAGTIAPGFVERVTFWKRIKTPIAEKIHEKPKTGAEN